MGKDKKNVLANVKEAVLNIDDKEKEAIKDAGKELLEVVKQAVEEKKTTGKVGTNAFISIAAAFAILVNVVFTSVKTAPLSTEIDNLKTELVVKDSIHAAEIESIYNSIPELGGLNNLDVTSDEKTGAITISAKPVK